MPLAPTWVVNVHVPVGGRSRRRPFAELRAVVAAIRRHPRAGAVGDYEAVTHFKLGLERFGSPPMSYLVVTVTTYLDGSRDDVERLARAISEAHPWEHPIIHCTGSEGSFLWSPR